MLKEMLVPPKPGWLVLLAFTGSILAQTQSVPQSAAKLKTLSMEQLMDIEVTSVSKRPEKLSETASAIQVITQADIRRSGATSLPEALRLASNLEVAQVDSHQWAISARGFNNTTANKMLVLIDGRTIYTPLYAGVFWDAQDTLLEDIDRIEVISGPGAALWGANAVNGVINITTKNAKDTQGALLVGGGGAELRGFGGVRYGGALGSGLHYRVYGKYFDRDSTALPSGRDAANDWHMGQGGFRLDWDAPRGDFFTLQGDLYSGRIAQPGLDNIAVEGGNVIGRWSRIFSEHSALKVQFYFDRTHRDIPGTFREDLDTYDVDVQHRFALGERQDFVWGLGYRLIEDDVGNTRALAFLPPRVSRQWFSAFGQDEIALVKDRLHLTLGTKIEHNDYTGLELQPSGRLAWKLSPRQTAWAAISRAVRTPSRIDRELFAPASPPFLLAGGPNFVSEELTADYRATDWWRLRAGYTELRVHSRPRPGSTDAPSGRSESNDPNHQLFLRSSLDLPRHFEFDTAFRYVTRIANQSVPAYTELDVRLGWQLSPKLEFSIVGQSLLHNHHAEFGDPTARQEIERSVYGKIVWRIF